MQGELSPACITRNELRMTDMVWTTGEQKPFERMIDTRVAIVWNGALGRDRCTRELRHGGELRGLGVESEQVFERGFEREQYAGLVIALRALDEEADAEQCLAGAGSSGNERGSALRQTTMSDVIESLDPGGSFFDRIVDACVLASHDRIGWLRLVGRVRTSPVAPRIG